MALGLTMGHEHTCTVRTFHTFKTLLIAVVLPSVLGYTSRTLSKRGLTLPFRVLYVFCSNGTNALIC